MPQQSEIKFALEVVRKLRQAGYEALWAGGCVRDRLLGKTPKDYDVATSAIPSQVRQLFGQKRTLAIGEAFGVILVLGPRGIDPIEVATFRQDDSYSDGRRPDSVTFSDARQDALRRDFTINGLFYDPLDDQILDYVEGQRDLKHRILRAIGTPANRFSEDKLRMLRAARFAATLELKIDPETFQAIQRMAPDITQVSAERIGEEVRRMFKHPTRGRAFQLLESLNLLKVILPELHQAIQTVSNREALRQRIQRVCTNLGETTFPVALASLLAVSGSSVDSCTALVDRFRLSNKESDKTAWLLRHLPMLASARSISWPKLQRVLVQPGIGDLLSVHEALTSPDDANLRFCQEKMRLPPDELNPMPLVSGGDLIASGLQPGKLFQTLLEKVRDAQLEGEIKNSAEATALALRLATQISKKESHGDQENG